MFYEQLKKSFASFQCLRLRIVAEVTDQIIIPGYQGGVLRGAFGKALKKIACPEEKQGCANCILINKCAYSYIFETPPPEDAEILRKYPFIPHPYTLNPAIKSSNTYNRGDVFEFDITLVGKAIDYLPFIVYAFIRMGDNKTDNKTDNGIGKLKKQQGKKPQRGGFQIKNIYALNAAGKENDTIYENQILQQADKTLCFDDAGLLSSRHSLDQISLNFLTPLRIRYKNTLCDDPQFHILIRNLLRRLSSLNYFHCNQKLDLPFKEIIEKAERVELVDNQTKWHDWSRYSGRQKKKMKLGGMAGMATYKGDLADFMPLLVLGSWVNIGKQTGFGLGRYEIKNK